MPACDSSLSSSLVQVLPSSVGDLAAGAPDPGVDLELGVTGDGERDHVGLGGLDGLAGGDDVVPRLRSLEAELLEDVGAVDDRADAGVPRHAVELVVVGAGVGEALDEVVAQALLGVDVVVERLERAGVGELGGPGGAGLGDVGGGAAGDRGHETVVGVGPLDLLDLDRGAGLLLRRPWTTSS